MEYRVKRLERAEGPPGKMVIITSSPPQTEEFGALLGAVVPRGTTISLEGGLGAGKTALVKGIARGLGIESEVLSPTFILVEEYNGGEMPLLHYDLYRLEELDEVERIGMFDSIDGKNLVVVEWGDRLPEGTMLFDVSVSIRIAGPSSRALTVTAAESLIAALDVWEGGA